MEQEGTRAYVTEARKCNGMTWSCNQRNESEVGGHNYITGTARSVTGQHEVGAGVRRTCRGRGMNV